MRQAEEKSDIMGPWDLFTVRSLLFLPASNPRAIARPCEWSVTPMHDQPRARQASAITAIGSAPSLNVECIWKSPR